MKPLTAWLRSALWWLVPLVALAALVGYETGFGRSLRKAPPQLPPVEPKPVSVALLPEYAIAGGVAARRETVERTLFTPTRRPAPTLVTEAAKPKMQRGQFALTGTLLVDGKNTAFLRENQGGRSRRVTQGETVNGLTVTEVKPDRVKLALGDEVEELVLRVTTNPRPTPQPPVAAAPAPVAPVPVPAQAAGAPPGTAGTQEVAQTLAERRRAARAAQAAAQAQTSTPEGNPIPAAPVVPPATGSNGAAPAAPPPARTSAAPSQGTWNDVYQRYQYRTR